MGIVEPGHLVLILLIALLIFGPSRVGELSSSLGRGMKDFRDASEGKIPALPAGGHCTACGAALVAEARFCSACGAANGAVRA